MANLNFLPCPTETEAKNFPSSEISRGYYLNPPEVYKIQLVVLTILSFIALVLLINGLINYYSNRFFFYDLMQASHKKFFYKPKNSSDIREAAMLPVSIPFPDKENVYSFIEELPNDEYDKKALNGLFKDSNDEISVVLTEDFIMHCNYKNYSRIYEDIWDDIPENLHNVLFDFATDNFVNYRNKDAVIQLMDLGIIDTDALTGRLKIMNPGFCRYIVLKYRHDDKIKEFMQESQNGFFTKLRLPIIITAVSALVLLMYLNKDSYDRVAVLGAGITSALALVHKLLGFNKSS